MRNINNERILSDSGEHLEKERWGRWRGNLDSLDASVKAFARSKERTPYGTQSFCFRIGGRVTNEELLIHRWFIKVYNYNHDGLEMQNASEQREPYAEISAREAAGFFRVEQWHNGQFTDALLLYLKDLWQSLLEDGLEPIPSLATLAHRAQYMPTTHVQAGTSAASWGQITRQRVHYMRAENAGTVALTEKGIPSPLYQQIRHALLDCCPLDTNAALRAVFTDARISMWRNDLPEANNKTERAEQVISFLLHKRHNSGKENGLVLLIKVLSDRVSFQDECHRRLSKLASNLEQELKNQAITSS